MRELVYGIHAVQAILDNDPQRILNVYLIKAPLMRRLKFLFVQIIRYKINIKECKRSYLDAKVKGALHQGIIAEIFCKDNIQEKDLPNFLTTHIKTIPLLLVLDGIVDPHNLGACLRTADAAGVHLVIATRNRSAYINDTVRKIASGSAERVPFVQVVNISRVLRLLQLHNIWIIGTVVQSKQVIFESKLVGPLAFVMGSENHGLRRLTKKNCDELVSIPIFSAVASLNVSVATGICLFEVLRQRKFM